MSTKVESVSEYIDQLPADRKSVIQKLRTVISENLPDGFSECISYGMIGYVVPHSIYPGGYHVDPSLPLPFINLASQKSHVALYHSGVYADTELLEWFTQEYPKHASRKLDMGKSCIRFKKMDDIPYKLIGELVRKMSVEQWVTLYEETVKRKK